MESVIVEREITERPEHATEANQFKMCTDSGTTAEPSGVVYIEHELVKSEEDPPLCRIKIIKEKHLTRVKPVSESCAENEMEGDGVEASDPLPDSEDENGNSSDMEVEFGESDIVDVLAVEKDQQADGSIRQYDQKLLAGDVDLDAQKSTQDSTIASTKSTAPFLPGLQICPQTPLLRHAAFSQPYIFPVINGVDVCVCSPKSPASLFLQTPLSKLLT